ncbi:MAG: hypothetical protein ACRD12_10690 [Acidimicrobiales bacterium]
MGLSGTTGGLTLGANQVTGNVTVDNNTAGLPVVKANTAARGKAGQCAAL